jgi:hypothetical protein
MLATELIAPCGMNCGVCHRYLRAKDKCPGCRGADSLKMVSCVRCVIKNCPFLVNNPSKFCYECFEYPCRRLKSLDKRYRTKYKMSMIENMSHIRALGFETFKLNEKERWRCRSCGGPICVHKGYCLNCGPLTGQTA